MFPRSFVATLYLYRVLCESFCSVCLNFHQSQNLCWFFFFPLQENLTEFIYLIFVSIRSWTHSSINPINIFSITDTMLGPTAIMVKNMVSRVRNLGFSPGSSTYLILLNKSHRNRSTAMPCLKQRGLFHIIGGYFSSI